MGCFWHIFDIFLTHLFIFFEKSQKSQTSQKSKSQKSQKSQKSHKSQFWETNNVYARPSGIRKARQTGRQIPRRNLLGYEAKIGWYFGRYGRGRCESTVYLQGPACKQWDKDFAASIKGIPRQPVPGVDIFIYFFICLGFFLYFFDICLILLGYVLDIFGICLGYFWDIFGICLGYFWNIFGIFLGYSWDMFGMFLGYFWDMLGIFLTYFLHIFNIFWA